MDKAKTLYLFIWMQAPRQKAVVAGSLLIPEQVYQEVLSLYHQQGEAIREQSGSDQGYNTGSVKIRRYK